METHYSPVRKQNYVVNVMSDTSPDEEYTPISEIAVGDFATVYGRGKFRTGVVVKVGKKNITVSYTTPSAVQDAEKWIARSGSSTHLYGTTVNNVQYQEGDPVEPSITNKVTNQFWKVEV